MCHHDRGITLRLDAKHDRGRDQIHFVKEAVHAVRQEENPGGVGKGFVPFRSARKKTPRNVSERNTLSEKERMPGVSGVGAESALTTTLGGRHHPLPAHAPAGREPAFRDRGKKGTFCPTRTGHHHCGLPSCPLEKRIPGATAGRCLEQLPGGTDPTLLSGGRPRERPPPIGRGKRSVAAPG